MEALLEKIAANTDEIALNTRAKTSFYILLSQRSTHIRTKFNPIIQLDNNKKYEIALVNLETYYSFPNIDATNNNFRYSPDAGKTWLNVNIPEGCYEIEDMNVIVHRIMKENRHYDAANDEYYVRIKPNNNTSKCVMNITGNYRVDFTTANSIRTVLGFNSKVYATGYHESENIVNIINVNSLRVTSDIIDASYSNGEHENIIHSFFPNVGPGYKIIEAPINLVYLPITLNKISQMETKLTNQNGKLINLRGEELSIRFHIRAA